MKYFFLDQTMKVTEVGYGGNSEELFCHLQPLHHLHLHLLEMAGAADEHQRIIVQMEIHLLASMMEHALLHLINCPVEFHELMRQREHEILAIHHIL
jgi:hypothetical protein